ncbi:phosphate ABC transporter permease subunit PstC [Litorivicinus sp.]|nr:phosphate ABC transporter permease subunit PstC [Litorivicinus sp.]
MSFTNLMLTVLVIGALYFIAGQRVALALRSSKAGKLHSLPHYHGVWAALTSALPALFVLLIIVIGKDLLFQFWAQDYFPQDVLSGDAVDRAIALAKVANVVNGIDLGEVELWVRAAGDAWIRWEANAIVFANSLVLAVSLVGGLLGYRRINLTFRSRNNVERILTWMLIGSSLVAIFTTIGIVLSVLFESIRFFKLIPPQDFLFGLEWNPQFEGAERAGSGGGTATYGMVPMFVGTFLISAIALTVAVPIGLFSAIYLAEYATPRIRGIVKPLLEILAGVPTVVYGFFAALTVAPVVKSVGESIGFEVASESALAAGLVMGVMIIPFISSLSDDVINAVPQSLRDAAYGLGSTRSEAVRQVVLPAALPGIVAAVILAVSRAVGETMIVVMAAGLAANLSFNPLDAVTTVTSQIVTILVGDQEFESAKTLSAFALALMLIITTLALNYFALQIVKKYREQYD